MREFKPFNKNFIPSHTLQEQIAALKEKLWQSDRSYADTTPPKPFDDDELDEVPTPERTDK